MSCTFLWEPLGGACDLSKNGHLEMYKLCNGDDNKYVKEMEWKGISFSEKNREKKKPLTFITSLAWRLRYNGVQSADSISSMTQGLDSFCGHSLYLLNASCLRFEKSCIFLWWMLQERRGVFIILTVPKGSIHLAERVLCKWQSKGRKDAFSREEEMMQSAMREKRTNIGIRE